MFEARGHADTAAALVYATFPSRAAAMAAGKALIEARLAACINILPSMISIYRWNGQIETAEEVVLLAKLPPGNTAAVIEKIVAVHPYDNPAVVVMPVVAGAAAYLDWIWAETRDPGQA